MATKKNKESELKCVNIRMVKEPSFYGDKPISTPDDAVDVMADEMKNLDREIFCIMNLKSNGKVINVNIVSIGTLNSSIVSPREVFKSSILSNAAAIIAIHNHPSGSLSPSAEDIEVTKRLSECGALMDIRLLDHIIVSGDSGNIKSMRAEGYIDEHSKTTVAREKGLER